jgi:hypothetical protein
MDGGLFGSTWTGVVASHRDVQSPELMSQLATVNQESRAKAARHLRVLEDAKPPLGNLTQAMGSLFSKKQSLGFGSEALSVGERHPVQESPPHGFRPI